MRNRVSKLQWIYLLRALGNLFRGHVSPTPFALSLGDMNIACRGASEDRTAARAFRFGDHARLFSLMAEEVAKCGKLASVTSVIPTLRLWSETYDSNLLLGV